MTASLSKNDFRFSLPERIDEAALADLDSSAVRPSGEKPYPWILHPVLDVLFACGGIVWLAFLTHLFLVPAGIVDGIAMLTISSIGVILLAETHTASTLIVVYRNSETRSRYAFYTRWLAAACALLAIASLLSPVIGLAVAKIYLLLVPHHFMAQAFGIAMLYCMKRGYKVGKWEREALLLFCRSVTVYAMLRQLTYPKFGAPTLFGISLPFWGPLPEWICVSAEQFLIFSAILTATMLLTRTLKTGELFPIPAQLTLLTGVSAFVMAPTLTGVYWLYLAAFFHGSQYLMVITAQHIKENGMPRGMSSHKIARQLFRWRTVAFCTAIAIISLIAYLVIPYFMTLFHFDAAISFFVIFVTVNIFYIITDGALWKLRDPKLRAQLIH